jgi:hypothetical protein
MLEFYKRPTQVFEWNKAITTPPDPSRLENWKNGLSNDEISDIEFICSSLMIEYSYQKMGKRPITFISKVNFLIPFLKSIIISKVEQHFFKIPFRLRHFILSKYRKKTKVIAE